VTVADDRDASLGTPRGRERTALPELLVHLSRAVRSARLIDPRDLEEADVRSIRDKALPTIRSLVRFTAETLASIAGLYGSERSDGDDAVEEDRRRGIADLARVGKLELVGALQQIREPLDGVEHSALLARAIRCRGMIVSVATSVDEIVCTTERWTRTLDNEPELKESMIVRGAYAAFRDRIGQLAPRDGDDIFPALATVRDAIGSLVEAPVGDLLRFADRESLLGLRGRLDLWLGDAGGNDERTGRLLWEETCLLTSMLMQINNRQELIAHDIQASRRLLDRLSRPDARITLLDSRFVTELLSLRGRDTAVDRVIDYVESRLASELEVALSALRDGLSAGSEDPARQVELDQGAAGRDIRRPGGVHAGNRPSETTYEFDMEAAGQEKPSR
jgi:hypothetical protein